MAATERAFSETPPARLYVDTDFLVRALVATEEHHQRCARFLQRLQAMGLTEVHLSTLVWIEFAHVVMKKSFRERLPAAVQEHIGPERWQKSLVREQYLQGFLVLLDALLRQFQWAEVPLGTAVRTLAVRYMAQHNLKSHDAVHLASATRSGVLDLASFDQGFRRVDGLVLWNDQVYASR